MTGLTADGRLRTAGVSNFQPALDQGPGGRIGPDPDTFDGTG
jgi:hypothetical protein